MVDMEDSTSNFLKGILVGSLLGAIAGMLFAPKSGKSLRSDIVRKSGDVLDESKRMYSDARDRAEEVLDQAFRSAEELKREADRQITEARSKAEELLTGAQEAFSGLGKSARGAAHETKEQLKVSKDVLSKAVEAGVEAAMQSISKVGTR